MNTKSLLASAFALSIAAVPAAWAQSSQQSYPPRVTTDVPEDRDPVPSTQQVPHLVELSLDLGESLCMLC